MTLRAAAAPDPHRGLLTAGPGVAEWELWSTRARLVVTDPAVLGRARDLVDDELARVAAAVDRFDPDSELHRVEAANGAPVAVSSTLADVLSAALLAAASTDGDLDPTLGDALAALGYDRDLAEVQAHAVVGVTESVLDRAVGRPSWRDIVLVDGVVQLPPGTALDLGACAKAWVADRCAATVHEKLGIGVLVGLGGDIATAGPAPRTTGWQIRVQDRPGDPACTVRIPAGAALATSSTVGRTWQMAGHDLHHILDPRTCRPVEPVWASVSVVGPTCLRANAFSTAGLVRGWSALAWFRALGLAARLVRVQDFETIHLGGWPDERIPA